MKCLILAGGHGERLWPLSRKNNPKQFIRIQKNHSIFQETVARNIPYCDEFIIVTGYEYRYIVENQMKAFQGTPYRCVYEDEPRKTTAAILLSCLDLQPSEYVFVVAADHIIDSKAESKESMKSYQDSILQAKEYAKNGYISLFGMREEKIHERYGYIDGITKEHNVKKFIVHPDRYMLHQSNTAMYRNLGMLLFINDQFQHDLAKYSQDVYTECCEAYKHRKIDRNYTFYSSEVLNNISPISIEECLIAKSTNCKAVITGFPWKDLDRLEDIENTDYQIEGVNVTNSCTNTTIINNSANQAVIVNDLDNVLVVNTPDAVYVGRQGKSGMMKQIFTEFPELKTYGDAGTVVYRAWGYYVELVSEANYRIRQVYLLPGKTIYAHRHIHRIENWTIVQGCPLITLNGLREKYSPMECVHVCCGAEHQISNPGPETVMFIETAVGELIREKDMEFKQVADMTENQLGCAIDPMVKLIPAFKDYLWGGTKLRDIYKKPCDYEIIAESWEVSAHPAGQSIIGSGRHKGLSFGEYLDVVGREVLGWKCLPLKNFPLLIKFIDAQKDLSVQVHPNDEYALEHENEYGKNEMWYVIDAEPGAGLYVGFNQDVTAEIVENSIKNNTIMQYLNFYPTKPGDVFFIPAGTVHAIGAGNLICEIQQSSNCTYRLYDYDRRDKYGNPRELHLQKALDVLNFQKYNSADCQVTHDSRGRVLCSCKYFETALCNVDGSVTITMNDAIFNALICIEGFGTVQLKNYQLSITAGESIFIPAQNGEVQLNGTMKVIITHI